MDVEFGGCLGSLFPALPPRAVDYPFPTRVPRPDPVSSSVAERRGLLIVHQPCNNTVTQKSKGVTCT